MKVSQAKIDLAVLLKLFQHAEGNGEAETPQGVRQLFTVEIPLHRIVAALETLEQRAEVLRKHDRYHEDEGLWLIARKGTETVENALRAPNSFIARLNVGGDSWLESDKAASAKLNKLPRYRAQDPAIMLTNDDVVKIPDPRAPAIHLTNNFGPTNTVAVETPQIAREGDKSGWWNFGAAVLIGIATIIVTLWVAGKI